tara:strand:+ start:313 stop:549 length:237 start_codon:yes stop_codon:yes gene_type:complete
MPQIGWFEILIIVILAILIIGPKDFPIILRKIGNWIANIKKYFGEFQKNVLDENISFDDKTSLEENYPKTKDEIKKDD